MNRAERFLHSYIKKNPKLKNVLRDAYQTVLSKVPVKDFIINNSLINRPGYFFGFHDKSPWNHDDSMLLANRFNIPNRSITRDDSIDVGIFSGKDFLEFTPLAITKSFNWQQGCLSQWLGRKNHIIFNSFDGLKNISIVIDAEGKEVTRFDKPVAAVSPDGRCMLSYDFSRLALYAKGYGYENGTDEEADLKIPLKQGLYLIDI